MAQSMWKVAPVCTFCTCLSFWASRGNQWLCMPLLKLLRLPEVLCLTLSKAWQTENQTSSLFWLFLRGCLSAPHTFNSTLTLSLCKLTQTPSPLTQILFPQNLRPPLSILSFRKAMRIFFERSGQNSWSNRSLEFFTEYLSLGTPKPRNPPCFVSVQSFVLSSDLIASDVNQCDSLIFKSRLIGCKFWLIGFDWSPAKPKPFETVDWLLSLIININYTYKSIQSLQDWTTLELAIRIHNVKGYSDEYCSSSIDATPVA